MPALWRAQQAIGGGVTKNKQVQAGSRRYGYADLGAVLDTIEPAFRDEHLFWMSATYPASVVVRIIHADSGEWVETEVCVTSQGLDAQGVGSATTYGRRYGLMALLGLAAEDDDGQAAKAGHTGAQASSRQSPSVPAAHPPQGGYRADAIPAPASRPNLANAGAPLCPTCGGDCWDNRPKKASGQFSAKSPDFKCKNKVCGGVIWKYESEPSDAADAEHPDGPPVGPDGIPF
jgi:hypothetical protein